MATIGYAPAATAPSRAARPTPPSPNTATLSPGRTPAVLKTAPTPVSTAQPNSAAISAGRCGGTRTAEAGGDHRLRGEARNPQVLVQRRARAVAPGRGAGKQHAGRVGARAPGSHSAGRPSVQQPQRPQAGTKENTTCSPGTNSVTPGPTSTTTPVASWPSAIGIGRGRTPSITERSEWHSPAAVTRTRISPGPGAARVTVSSFSGRVSA